jgi:hypothetical protein
MFRKPTAGFRKILFLLTVPAIILLVRYRMQDLPSVKDRMQWQPETGEFRPENVQGNYLTSDGRA